MTTPTTSDKYEIQHLTLADGWSNISTDEHGNRIVYATQTEAELELKDFIAECLDPVAKGDLADFDPAEYRVTRHETNPSSDMQDCIAILWHIDDVRNVRPELTEEQCREVLRRCEDGHNAEIGINWEVIRTVADDCFPATAEDGQ